MAFTIVVRTNAAQGTDVLIPDVGVFIPNSGGSVTFDRIGELQQLQASVDLRTFLTDDAFGAGSSTLILNDGVGDIAQADALNFLDTVEFPAGDEDYGLVKTNEDGEIDQDLTFDGTATITNAVLGGDLNANNNQITGLPLTPSGPTDAVSNQYVQDLFVANRSWKELVLSQEQFDSVNSSLSQAIAFFLDDNAADGDTFTISDGVVTETFNILAAPVGVFDVQLGANADDTMTNLAAAITANSTLWDAVLKANLESINDGSGISTAGGVIVIYRANQSATSFDDRIFGTFATPANAQYVNYNGALDYNSSVNAQLPAVDPAQKEFGVGYATADLSAGQSHLARNSDEISTYDSDTGQWNVTGSTLPYAPVGEIQSLGSSASAGVSTNVARGDHVHPHGDRGGDGSASQHDADQVDVEGTYDNIGNPADVEEAIGNINAALGGAKAGRLLNFGVDQRVPGSGTRFLETSGTVVSSAAGVRMLRAGTITGASVQVDNADGSRDYNLSIRVNGTEQETLALASGNTGNQSVAFTATYAAGDVISVAMVRTSGANASSFNDIVSMIEIVDD